MATTPTFTIDDVKSANFMQGLGDFASKSNWRNGAMWGAGLGAAKGLLSDPGTNPDGSPRSRIGAAARGAVGGAVVGGTAGHLLNKYVPHATNGVPVPPATNVESVKKVERVKKVKKTELPVTPATNVEPVKTDETVKKQEFLVTPAKLAHMIDCLNKGIAPEGAKPYIREIIKRASAAGIEVTAELVAHNIIKIACAKLAASTSDDLNHDLPGDLDAKSTTDRLQADRGKNRKVKAVLRETSFTPVQLKAKG